MLLWHAPGALNVGVPLLVIVVTGCISDDGAKEAATAPTLSAPRADLGGAVASTVMRRDLGAPSAFEEVAATAIIASDATAGAMHHPLEAFAAPFLRLLLRRVVRGRQIILAEALLAMVTHVMHNVHAGSMRA